jgi:hypothetical protein
MSAPSTPTPREVVAQAMFTHFFGGTSDPALTDMAESMARDLADQAFAALAAAGFAVVPRVPTEAMTLQGWLQLPSLRPDTGYVVNVYTAMIFAAEGDQR